MSLRLHRVILVALLLMGSAILLFSCKSKQSSTEESLDAIKTEESENLTIIMSENGRKSYLFKTPLLEGYTLGRDPYREFRKGISITTYQDDSLTTVNAVLVANYAIYYENRKLWEAKGDVVITKHDGTRLYTQQLFWNSMTKRIYSNVDTKLVTDTDEVVGEGFESDEEMNEPRFRRWKGKMQVDTEQLRKESKEGKDSKDDADKDSAKSEQKVERKSQPQMQPKSSKRPNPNGQSAFRQKSGPHSRPNGTTSSNMHRPNQFKGGSKPPKQGPQQTPQQRLHQRPQRPGSNQLGDKSKGVNSAPAGSGEAVEMRARSLGRPSPEANK